MPVERALEVVSRLCGLHAQLSSSAELTLWARVEGLEPGWVDRALWEEGTLYKTWAMRGTLHLLPAAERGMWNAALGTYDNFLKPAWSKAFGIEPDEVERLIDVVGETLDGRELTRGELADAVAERAGSDHLAEKLRESWGAFLKPAAFRGKLQFAPNRGRNVCFTLPGPAEAMEPDEALQEVVRRYLSAYGPASRDEVARWWATSPAKAGKLLDAIGAEPVDVEGTELRALPEPEAGEAREGGPAAARVRPVGGGRHAADRAVRAGRRRPRADLPPPGLADAGAAGVGAGRGPVAPRAQGQADRGVHRAAGEAARLGSEGRGGGGREPGRRSWAASSR